MNAPLQGGVFHLLARLLVRPFPRYDLAETRSEVGESVLHRPVLIDDERFSWWIGFCLIFRPVFTPPRGRRYWRCAEFDSQARLFNS